MFGYFRIFLASLVLLSHVGVNLQGANPGVAAVVSFYMLSGFVVSDLFSKVYIKSKPQCFEFYYERVLRIFPLYLFFAALTLAFVVAKNYGSPIFNFHSIVNNILIIPLNYYMLLDSSIIQDPKQCLIPPAWSLGTELQAYIIMPFIIKFKQIKVTLAIASFCVFFAASLGIIDTDIYGYRVLPGTLFIFILGVSIYNMTSPNGKSDMFDNLFPAFVYAGLAVLFIILGVFQMLLSPFVRETILGILIGMPSITYLAKSRFTLPMNRYLGELSYGIFLSHSLGILIIKTYFPMITGAYHVYIPTIFLFSLLVSAVGVFVIEKRIKTYRYHLSNFIKSKNYS